MKSTTGLREKIEVEICVSFETLNSFYTSLHKVGQGEEIRVYRVPLIRLY